MDAIMDHPFISKVISDLKSSEHVITYYNASVTLLNDTRVFVNKKCDGKEAWQIILGTFLISLILIKIHSFVFQDESIISRIKKWFFKFARRAPILGRIIQSKINKSGLELENSVRKLMKGIKYQKEIPKSGLNEEEILKKVKQYISVGEVNWSEGKASGTVYNGNKELTDLMTKVYGMTAWSNPLHPDVFPGVLAMEAEIIRMAATLFNGGPETCGSVTTGGTESIFLASKAYRDYALEVKGIKKPEMIISTSTHAAFAKAAITLGIKLITVPVNPKTMKCDVRGMKRAITKNTIMLAVSAPQFPHGVMDHIPEVSELGYKYNIPVHVDACLGGFLIVFMEKAGFPMEPFDFRLRGVTSISADTHKYAYAPKGSSVILYREKVYRHYQYYVLTDWSGGVYGTTSLAGSRPGGIIAACWAALLYHGEDEYVKITRQIIMTTRYLTDKLRKVNGLKILGEPEVSVIAFASDYFNIYTFAEMMGHKGWNLNILQYPSSIHLCVTVLHTKSGVADKFLESVNEIADELCSRPKEKVEGSAAMYGLAQALPDRSIVSSLTWYYLDAVTSTDET